MFALIITALSQHTIQGWAKVDCARNDISIGIPSSTNRANHGHGRDFDIEASLNEFKLKGI